MAESSRLRGGLLFLAGSVVGIYGQLLTTSRRECCRMHSSKAEGVYLSIEDMVCAEVKVESAVNAYIKKIVSSRSDTDSKTMTFTQEGPRE